MTIIVTLRLCFYKGEEFCWSNPFYLLIVIFSRVSKNGMEGTIFEKESKTRLCESHIPCKLCKFISPRLTKNFFILVIASMSVKGISGAHNNHWACFKIRIRSRQTKKTFFNSLNSRGYLRGRRLKLIWLTNKINC